MSEIFEVVFVDKIVGSERRAIVEWKHFCQYDLHRVVSRAKVSIIKDFGCKASDLIFRSLRLI